MERWNGLPGKPIVFSRLLDRGREATERPCPVKRIDEMELIRGERWML